MSKAADRSSRMRTDDLESFAIRRASVTESSAVSVEWPLLKPDCLASSLFPVAQLVEHGASNAKIMGSIPRESKS